VTNEATTALLCVGLPCAWWGAVVAISFLETPLKFRVPGITMPLALGVGRLVFRALNVLESGFALVVAVGLLGSATDLRASSWVLFAAICLILLVQGGFLRPALDRRATALANGVSIPPSRLHSLYIGGEVAKFLALPALAIGVATALP
jgi:hypothetical protein